MESGQFTENSFWPNHSMFDCFITQCSTIFVPGQSLLQHGKVNFTRCISKAAPLQNVQYPQVFSSSSNIRILASVSHENKSLSVHDSAVVWTTDVTQNSFRICVLESGLGTNGSAAVNWIAFRGPPSGALDGAASFNAFTSGKKCERVDFAQVWFRCRVVFFLKRSQIICRNQQGVLELVRLSRVSYIGRGVGMLSPDPYQWGQLLGWLPGGRLVRTCMVDWYLT